MRQETDEAKLCGMFSLRATCVTVRVLAYHTQQPERCSETFLCDSGARVYRRLLTAATKCLTRLSLSEAGAPTARCRSGRPTVVTTNRFVAQGSVCSISAATEV